MVTRCNANAKIPNFRPCKVPPGTFALSRRKWLFVLKMPLVTNQQTNHRTV